MDKDGCWIWQYGVRATYAFIKRAHTLRYGLNYMAEHRMGHRLACWVKHGDVTWSVWALHKCDKHMCVRPECMFPGDHADNMADASAKGRIARTRVKLYGSKNPAWKGGVSRAYRKCKAAS